MDIHEKLHDKIHDEMKLVSKINLKGKTTSLMEEFKSFAFKGNVVDMAIGIIIGAAFGKIVTSMVNDIIMPLISIAIPNGSNYAEWKWTVTRGTEIVNGVETARVIDIPYGLFLSDVVSFLIVAMVLFFVIKKFLGFIVNQKKKTSEAPATPASPPAPSSEEKLLTEIRDLLKQQAAQK